MLKAVLFDMDGVIVDTEPLHHKAYKLMFDEFGIAVSDELYQTFTGQSTINICTRITKHFNKDVNPVKLELSKRHHFNHLFDRDPDLKLLDGVFEIIEDYYRNQVTMVLASSASRSTIDRVLNRFDLDKFFIAKHSGADLKASKPHPEIFINAAASTGFKATECMVIEDSTNGIKAAKSAGIFCVGYNSKHSKNQDYSQADLVVNNLLDLKYDLIKDLI